MKMKEVMKINEVMKIYWQNAQKVTVGGWGVLKILSVITVTSKYVDHKR